MKKKIIAILTTILFVVAIPLTVLASNAPVLLESNIANNSADDAAIDVGAISGSNVAEQQIMNRTAIGSRSVTYIYDRATASTEVDTTVLQDLDYEVIPFENGFMKVVVSYSQDGATYIQNPFLNVAGKIFIGWGQSSYAKPNDAGKPGAEIGSGIEFVFAVFADVLPAPIVFVDKESNKVIGTYENPEKLWLPSATTSEELVAARLGGNWKTEIVPNGYKASEKSSITSELFKTDSTAKPAGYDEIKWVHNYDSSILGCAVLICYVEAGSTPDPAPTPDPDPTPDPNPDPTPNPNPDPTPNPNPDPTPNPNPDPTPNPNPDPTPNPNPDPTPNPNPDPTPDPTPNPNPDPTPDPTPNPTERIPDEGTPLAPTPEVITDEEVPLTNASLEEISEGKTPFADADMEEILDDAIPLAAPPQTADSSIAWIWVALIGLAGGAVVLLRKQFNK